MAYDQLTVALPRDLNSKLFVGPSGKVPKGLVDPTNSDEAITFFIPISTDGTSVLVNANGMFVQGPIAQGVSVSTVRPLIMGSRAEATTPIAVTDDQAVVFWLDLLGALATRLKDSSGVDAYTAAAALADGIANPTVSRLAMHTLVFNGSTWDRLRGDTTNGLYVDITRNVRPNVSAATDVSLGSSAVSQTLLAANSSRQGLLLNNTDSNAALLRYSSSAASAGQFTVKIPASAYWEMPEPVYRGAITAIWEADGSGALIGSEL